MRIVDQILRSTNFPRTHCSPLPTAQASADPFQAAQAALGERNAAWRVNGLMQKVPRPREFEPRTELANFTDADLDKSKQVARTVKKKTGIGVDRWHSSMLLSASDGAYWALLDI